MIRAFYFCFSRQLADREAGKNIPESGLCALPDGMNTAPGLALTGFAACQADVEARGTFHSLNNLKQRGLVAVHAEAKAAAIAAMRSDKTGVHQALHDFREKTAANAGGVLQTDELGLGTRGQGGKVNHDADSIVGSAIDLHGSKMDLRRPVVGTMNTQIRAGRSIKGHFRV